MGVSNPKYFCTECQWAAKGPCPQHPGSSLMMGKDWRPGKKGRRTRLWDNRNHGSQVPIRWNGPWRRRLYQAHPMPDRTPPPEGLVVLGATDFSHDSSHLAYNDPVRVSIRAKNSKAERSRPLDPPPSRRLGWPFPFNWSTGQYEDPRA
jgi:hypothetical protein